jgi:hypothetical protein
MNYTQARTERVHLQRQLTALLNTNGASQRDITHIRGRLLNAIRTEFRLAPVHAKAALKRFYLVEINNHSIQLKNRTQIEKRRDQNIVSQVSKEVVLKFQRAKTNLRRLNLEPTATEKLEGISKFLGGSLSSLGSVAKFPVAMATRVLMLTTGALAKMAVAPFHIVSGLYQKIWNPEKKYSGKKLNKIEDGLKRRLDTALRGLGERTRRL